MRDSKIFGITENNIFGVNKPANKKKKPAALKRSLMVRFWKGKYQGPCYCCGTKKNFHEVHLGRIKAGGKYEPANCRLICQPCNSEMGITNMKSFMKKHYPERYKLFFSSDIVKKPLTKKKPKAASDPFSFKPSKINFGNW